MQKASLELDAFEVMGDNFLSFRLFIKLFCEIKDGIYEF